MKLNDDELWGLVFVLCLIALPVVLYFADFIDAF